MRKTPKRKGDLLERVMERGGAALERIDRLVAGEDFEDELGAGADEDDEADEVDGDEEPSGATEHR